MDVRPIGVFDSGLGGVSTLKEAMNILPSENFIYYGDNKNAPYGDKTEQEVHELSFACADALVSMGVKAILIGCNTATATAIRDIRSRLSIPVVSIEPAIKPACMTPGSGKVVMMATKATTQLERYRKLQRSMPDPDRVINVACPGIVERIESGVFSADGFDDLFESFFAPYEGMLIDGIVLGCTHYVFIKEAVRQYAQNHFQGSCTLYDGNLGTAKQLKRVLTANDLLNTEGNCEVKFCTSGDRDVVFPLFETLLKREIK